METPVKEAQMKTRRLTLAMTLLLAAGVPAEAGAQSGHDLFQQALVMERAEGNLDGAVGLYNRILAEHQEERALCAQALMQMGSFYERLGRPEAADAYQRVLEEFPDQAGQAREARVRLDALVDAKESERSVSRDQEPTYRFLLDDAPAHHPSWARRFDLSPDGRQIVFPCRDFGGPGVCLIEEVGGHPRLIRELPEGFIGWRGGIPRWSPDGSMIAVQDVDEHGASIIDPGGNLITRVLFDHEPKDLAWNPDQQGLTYTPRYGKIGGIRSVTLDGQETILVENPEGRRIGRFAGYSPDGRWLAFGSLAVMPAGGGPIHRIEMPEGLGVRKPVWGPGGFIYFVSGGSGANDQNVWRVKIDLETGEKVGDPEQLTFYMDAGVMGVAMARDAGNMVYVLLRERHTVWVAPSDELDAPRALARGRNPIISPDGATVYFEGEGPGNDAVFSVPTSGGTPHRLTPEAHSVVPGDLRLLPDGSSFIYWAALGEPPSREGAYFHVSATGGEPVRLPVPASAYTPSVSPDGSTLAYALWDFVPTDGPDNHPLFVVPVAGGEPTLLAEFPVVDPFWSPDGRYFAAVHYEDSNDTYQISVLPVEGGEPRFLVNEDMEDALPGVSWHPDSQRLNYTRRGAIWVAYLDGRPPTLLYDEPDLASWGGRWAPDGESFFSEGYDSNGWATYRRSPDGTSELLWEGGGPPSISADGRTWVWSTRVWSWELWMLEGLK